MAIIEARVKHGAEDEDGDKEARAFLRELKKARPSEGGGADSMRASAAKKTAAGASSAQQAKAPPVGAVDLTPGIDTKEDKLRALFMLPASEMILEDFTCRCTALPGKLGKLYVTTSHVCYSVRWGDDDSEHTPAQLVLDIESIYSMRNKSGWIGGSLFVTAFGNGGVARETEFDHFPFHKKCCALILERAKVLAHEIEILN